MHWLEEHIQLEEGKPLLNLTKSVLNYIPDFQNTRNTPNHCLGELLAKPEPTENTFKSSLYSLKYI